MSINDEIKQARLYLDKLIKRRDAGPWVPTEEYFKTDNAFCINESGDICLVSTWVKAQELIAYGNIYKTREEAEYESSRTKALVAANKIIAKQNLKVNFVADWGDLHEKKLIFYYDLKEGSLKWQNWCSSQPTSELLPFRNENYESIKARITQEQIDLIWRLN